MRRSKVATEGLTQKRTLTIVLANRLSRASANTNPTLEADAAASPPRFGFEFPGSDLFRISNFGFRISSALASVLSVCSCFN
jgi:hypothetical protein